MNMVMLVLQIWSIVSSVLAGLFALWVLCMLLPALKAKPPIESRPHCDRPAWKDEA